MHGVRVALLERQAESIGLPLRKVELPENAAPDRYAAIMKEALRPLKNEGASVGLFGDIFLEDLRQYREEQMRKLDMTAAFPIWNISTHELITTFINSGFQAIVTCVDERKLDKSFVGRKLDQSFLNDLPQGIDPCGENGEYHSFVFDGPIFAYPVAFEKGKVFYRQFSEENTASQLNNGFWYCDLLPEQFQY